jgi:antitoxin (DNA-binding transcriptional repressor) of toxin-antitoxin stability system
MAEANSPLTEYVQDVSKEPLVVIVDGKPVAALVPIENADLETVMLSTHPKFVALLDLVASRCLMVHGLKLNARRRRRALLRSG